MPDHREYDHHVFITIHILTSGKVRWDPNREDEVFFNQSAMLYAQYYLVQIIVHRPYIPTPGKQSPLSFPSLAICTNAARSCSHVMDIQQRRLGRPLPYQIVRYHLIPRTQRV